MTFKLIPNINKRLEQIARDEGRAGTAYSDFKVAHKGGEPCPICGSTVERVLVQNRGTCFCPRCQPFDSGPLIQKLARCEIQPPHRNR